MCDSTTCEIGGAIPTLFSIPDLEADQRGNQKKADGIRDDDHEIAFEDAVPDPRCRTRSTRLVQPRAPQAFWTMVVG
jgi:hypothetical protein